MATIKDVAKNAGVSIATVSRILNKKGKYTGETEKKVLRIAGDLGYTANLTAKSLKTGLTGTIGIVINEFHLLHYPLLLSTVLNVLSKQGFTLEIILNARLSECALLLSGGRFDGLLITDTDNDAGALRSLIQTGGDFVFLGGDIDREDVNLVEIDYFQGGYLAAKRLISLGHTEILFIEDNEDLFFTLEIKRGYLLALDENGIQYQESLIIPGDNRTPLSREMIGFSAVNNVIEEAYFSAILTTDDKIAYGALRASREESLKIPANISIIGFGNMSTSEYLYPQLTSIEIPVSQMGELGAEILINNINRKDNIVKRVKLKIQLIERESLVKKPTRQGNVK